MEIVLEQAWFVFGGLALAGGIWTARWITRSISHEVVDAIGDTLSERWNKDMERALRPLKTELETNGGFTLKDRVLIMDGRLSDIERQLEMDLLRHKFETDDIDGEPI